MAQSANKSGDDGPDGRGDLDAIKKRLGDLDAKLRDGAGSEDDMPAPAARGKAMGYAFRLVTELVVGILVGCFIGWQLDQWLDTAPLLLLIFFGLGTIAGIFNVVRTAREMQTRPEDPP